MARPHRIIPPLTPQDILRFWLKVRIRGPDECWPWAASRSTRGYGVFHSLSRTDGGVLADKTIRASRVAYTIANGPFPLEMCICHRCDNPPCVNPRHLFLGKPTHNLCDASKKGRLPHGKDHPRDNAKLTEEEVRQIRDIYAGGGISHRTLARKWGVGKRTVGNIITRETWKHVT